MVRAFSVGFAVNAITVSASPMANHLSKINIYLKTPNKVTVKAL
jgi:hypothetical protein